jgi:hypothetical protein
MNMLEVVSRSARVIEAQMPYPMPYKFNQSRRHKREWEKTGGLRREADRVGTQPAIGSQPRSTRCAPRCGQRI